MPSHRDRPGPSTPLGPRPAKRRLPLKVIAAAIAGAVLYLLLHGAAGFAVTIP